MPFLICLQSYFLCPLIEDVCLVNSIWLDFVFRIFSVRCLGMVSIVLTLLGDLYSRIIVSNFVNIHLKTTIWRVKYIRQKCTDCHCAAQWIFTNWIHLCTQAKRPDGGKDYCPNDKTPSCSSPVSVLLKKSSSLFLREYIIPDFYMILYMELLNSVISYFYWCQKLPNNDLF